MHQPFQWISQHSVTHTIYNSVAASSACRCEKRWKWTSFFRNWSTSYRSCVLQEKVRKSEVLQSAAESQRAVTRSVTRTQLGELDDRDLLQQPRFDVLSFSSCVYSWLGSRGVSKSPTIKFTRSTTSYSSDRTSSGLSAIVSLQRSTPRAQEAGSDQHKDTKVVCWQSSLYILPTVVDQISPHAAQPWSIRSYRRENCQSFHKIHVERRIRGNCSTNAHA